MAFFKYSTDHPTRESIARHVARDALSHRMPHLSDAELHVLRRAQAPKRHWAMERVDRWTREHHLEHPGQLRLRVGYDDGYFYVSDVHHLVTGHEADPVEIASETRSVAAGGPGQVMVSTCCEGNDAPVTLVLRRRAPTRGETGWAEATDVDLDLPTGRLVFASTGGTSDVVMVPAGRYRMRASGRGAVELEQDRERFRIELWPRRANAAMSVLRTAPQR